MNTKLKNILGLFLITALIAACDEDDNPLGDPSSADVETQLGEFLVAAEANANQIYNTVDEALRDSSFRANDSATVNGAVVQLSGSTVTIDFGTGVSGSDGITRSGVISLTLTGSDFLNTGARVDGGFNQFKVDGNNVSGTFSIENMGNNTFETSFTDVKFSPDFTLNANKDIVWQNGFSTPQDLSDDRYQIDGTSNGSVASDSSGISATISESFIYDKSCQYGLVSGIMDVTFSGDTLTYNNGEIDFVKADSCNNVYELKLTATDGSNVNIPLMFNGF